VHQQFLVEMLYIAFEDPVRSSAEKSTLLDDGMEKAFADLGLRLLFLQCSLPLLQSDSMFQWERWLTRNFHHVHDRRLPLTEVHVRTRHGTVYNRSQAGDYLSRDYICPVINCRVIKCKMSYADCSCFSQFAQTSMGPRGSTMTATNRDDER